MPREELNRLANEAGFDLGPGGAFAAGLGGVLGKDRRSFVILFFEHHQPDPDQPAAAEEAVRFGIEYDGLYAFGDPSARRARSASTRVP